MKKLLLTIIIFTAILNQLSKAQTVWQVSTVAGNGVSGNSGDGGPATSAQLSFNSYGSAMCKDAAGNLYVADSGNRSIRKITTTGVISTLANNIAFSEHCRELCIDANGNLYAVSGRQPDMGYGGYSILKITPAGVVSTFVNPNPNFYYIWGMCIDAAGNIYLADYNGPSIHQITPLGVVSTYVQFSSGNYPLRLCIDNNGNMFVNCSFNITLKITPSKVVSTFVTGDAFYNICCDNLGNVYTARGGKIIKYNAAGVSSTLIQSASGSSNIDACVPNASFSGYGGLFLDASGNFYLSETSNNKIRKITEVTPTPPVVNYLNLPASVCMGSTVDQSATTTGSSPQQVTTSNTININSPKAICKNDSFVFVLNSVDDGFGFFLDTIRQYNFTGTLINTIGLNEIGNEIITADTNNMIYAVHPDPNNSSISNIRRIFPNGFTDFAFNIPSFILDKVLALELGPDGYLYASENASGYIKKIDVNTSVVTDLPNPAPAFSFNRVVDFAFDKAGDMYLADIGLNKILKRNASDNNYYPAVPGLDTLLPNITSISIDTSAIGYLFVSSKVSNTPFSMLQASAPFNIQDTTIIQNTLNINKPLASMYVANGAFPSLWALDSINNQVKIISAGVYQIAPQLPSGLSYNIINGSIFGNAQSPSPLTTYTITVSNSFGTTTSTLSFEVAPPTTLSNTPGTSSTLGDQQDGLTIKYFSANNCSKMIEIADAQGGTAPGTVQVKETVSNLATFSSANFVGRVTEVNTQNPNAAAVLRLFFTHQDIVNYNAANGAGIDLTNDTLPTGLGTMQVAVLQLHTKENGHIEQIQHNPITANWIRAQQNWMVEFPITKFSTFYTGEPTELSTFTCENGSQSTIVSPNNFYIWNDSDSLSSSGQYMDTLVNRTGCDSIITLDLTLNAVGIENTPALDKGISLYPNPNSGLLHLDILNPNILITNVSITNLLGSEVYHANKVNSKSTIDLSTLQSGIYFVQISSEHEKITRKIILE
jgi:streptogramin lyase